jgi:hypothetical protein
MLSNRTVAAAAATVLCLVIAGSALAAPRMVLLENFSNNN